MPRLLRENLGAEDSPLVWPRKKLLAFSVDRDGPGFMFDRKAAGLVGLEPFAAGEGAVTSD